MARRLGVTVCAVAAAFAPASAGFASTLKTKVVKNVMTEAGPPLAYVNFTYTAKGVERNRLVVGAKGSTIVFTDPGARIKLSSAAGDGCAPLTAHVIRCVRRGRGSGTLKVVLGAGKDRVVTAIGGSLFSEVTIDGGAGNDTLNAARTGTGFPVGLVGGPGNDVITGGSRVETITPGPGNDVVKAGGGDDYIAEGPSASGSDRLDGGKGEDTVSYANRSAPVGVDMAAGKAGEAGEADTLAGFETASGGSGADTLIGSASADTLIGRPGNDTLQGAGGDDSLDAGEGDDTILAGDGNDRINPSDITGEAPTDGRDLIDAGGGDDFVSIGEQTAAVVCGEGIDRVDPLPLATPLVVLAPECETVGTDDPTYAITRVGTVPTVGSGGELTFTISCLPRQSAQSGCEGRGAVGGPAASYSLGPGATTTIVITPSSEAVGAMSQPGGADVVIQWYFERFNSATAYFWKVHLSR